MALQSRVINGSLTEIYAGGGNFVTEAFPTNFHTFAPKRILLNGQSTDDYKEVTPAERSAIEAEDAKFVEPPQMFIDLWNAAAGTFGRYNTLTGFFELNGFTDISYAEAVEIYLQGTFDTLNSAGKRFRLRTNLPITANQQCGTVENSFNSDNFWMEVQVANVTTLSTPRRFSAYPINIYHHPFGNKKLEKVIGGIDFHFATKEINWFKGATNLEEVEIYRLSHSINLGSCSKLNLASFQTLITNADSDSDSRAHPRIVTVHPDVYAKITDEANAEWHALLAAAAAKNITFATT